MAFLNGLQKLKRGLLIFLRGDVQHQGCYCYAASPNSTGDLMRNHAAIAKSSAARENRIGRGAAQHAPNNADGNLQTLGETRPGQRGRRPERQVQSNIGSDAAGKIIVGPGGADLGAVSLIA